MSNMFQSKIEKVTAKTIFDENIYYMIKWRGKPETENTWKPSEFFETSDELSFHIKKFEQETKLSEEKLFQKLEYESSLGFSSYQFGNEELDQKWDSYSQNSLPIEESTEEDNFNHEFVDNDIDYNKFESYTEDELLKKYSKPERNNQNKKKKDKITLLYEMDLQEKVYDYKKYGGKVLRDFKKFSDPKLIKQMMTIQKVY